MGFLNPPPGGVRDAPGAIFLTCPRCEETTTLFIPVVRFPLTFDCIGCQRRWFVHEPLPEHRDFRWYEQIRMETDNADTPAL